VSFHPLLGAFLDQGQDAFWIIAEGREQLSELYMYLDFCETLPWERQLGMRFGVRGYGLKAEAAAGDEVPAAQVLQADAAARDEVPAATGSQAEAAAKDEVPVAQVLQAVAAASDEVPAATGSQAEAAAGDEVTNAHGLELKAVAAADADSCNTTGSCLKDGASSVLWGARGDACMDVVFGTGGSV
jgi:hypothetical protein